MAFTKARTFSHGTSRRIVCAAVTIPPPPCVHSRIRSLAADRTSSGDPLSIVLCTPIPPQRDILSPKRRLMRTGSIDSGWTGLRIWNPASISPGMIGSMKPQLSRRGITVACSSSEVYSASNRCSTTELASYDSTKVTHLLCQTKTSWDRAQCRELSGEASAVYGRELLPRAGIWAAASRGV